MIISNKNKYIFVANPKTATTSVQSFLLQNDISARKNGIKIDGVKYSFKEHYTAAQIKNELGEIYEDFTVFGFVRNPYDKVVSSYHFLKNGKPITEGHKTSKWPIRLRMLSAKTMPFNLWSLLYPYKSNKEYFTDSDGNVIVDRIGLFENIYHDLSKILEDINAPFDCSNLPYKNRSTHKNYDSYIDNNIMARYLNKKLASDVDFYESAKSNIEKG